MLTLLLAFSLFDTEYRFSTPDHEVTMTVQFQEPFRGQPLAFYKPEDPGKRQCFTGKCIDRFVGAAAVVNFTLTRGHAKAPKPSQFRELVTLIEQSPAMPSTPPFDLTLKVVNGQVGDIQVMGYDEDGIADAERARMRAESQSRMWRRVRQELFLNGAKTPFAVIQWKHTMGGVEIVKVTGTALRAKN